MRSFVFNCLACFVVGLFLFSSCSKPVQPLYQVNLDAKDAGGFLMFNAHFIPSENEFHIYGLNLNRNNFIKIDGSNDLTVVSSLESLYSLTGFNPTVWGTSFQDSVFYTVTSVDSLILKLDLRDLNLVPVFVPLDSNFGVCNWFTETNIVKVGNKLLLPINFNSSEYATNPSELKAKFAAPQAAVYDLTDSLIIGFLGKFPRELQTRFYIDETHYQTRYNNGFVMSDFLIDTIRVYNDSFHLVNRIPAKSKYSVTRQVVTDSIYYDDDLYYSYLMERFSYAYMRYDSSSDVLIRVCLLTDNYVENGLIKPSAQKNFSIQFIKEGKLIAEHSFLDGKYRSDSVYLVDGKLILFHFNNESFTDLIYDVFDIDDFL